MEQTSKEGIAAVATEVPGRGRWLAAGGIVGALLMSACCLVPMVLVALGAAGAGIGKPVDRGSDDTFLAATSIACLAGSFWHLYLRPRSDCGEGGGCTRSSRSRVTEAALWMAISLVAASTTTSLWWPFPA